MDLSLFSLVGKVAVVTGVRQGLGQAMAVALAQAGADIVGVGTHGMGSTAALVRAEGVHAFEIVDDFSERGSAADAAAKAVAAFGRVDILVNNAGITPLAPAEDHSMEDFDRAVEVNLRSLFLLTRDVARHMIARGGGKIINTCSIQSQLGGDGDAAYVATKHAVLGLTRAWANEWGCHNIQVNGIAPGFMETANTARLREDAAATASITAQIPVGRWGQPKDTMGPVVFLASPASDYVNGHMLVVDGGLINR